jgi:hypothetical protein
VLVEDSILRAKDLDCGGGLVVAEEFGGITVHGVAEPVIVPKDGGTEALREGVVAAADIDRRDLAVVANVDHLAVDRIDGALEGEAAGGAHRGLVEHHHDAARQARRP